ncbi:MAG: exodeoxyribonuclease III [Betaproteobacteria bacterium]|jgi:exodeoxyribonuclease-3
MLRVISVNLNGIRAAAKKGLFLWLQKTAPDLVCLQEIKAQEADLSEDFLNPSPLKGYFHYAVKKGYSGTGVYSKHTPDEIQTGFGVPEFDDEGRYTALRFGKLWVISAYFPSGSSSEERQEAKFRFLDAFLPYLAKLKSSQYEILLCGDINIAHQEIDLKNWKGNLKNSGFLPAERSWLTQLFSELGYCDVYRRLHPEATDNSYTWWSQRGQAYNNNVGWRIDYQIATPEIAKLARSFEIYKLERFSDHAPLIVDYEYSL